MRLRRGATSQSTRNAASSASCVVRTVRWLRRCRRSHWRYCGLGVTGPAVSTFDMDFELLPEGVEIAIELGRAARGEGRRALAVAGVEADRVLRLHPARPARQHDHPFGQADGLADIVR